MKDTWHDFQDKPVQVSVLRYGVKRTQGTLLVEACKTRSSTEEGCKDQSFTAACWVPIRDIQHPGSRLQTRGSSCARIPHNEAAEHGTVGAKHTNNF